MKRSFPTSWGQPGWSKLGLRGASECRECRNAVAVSAEYLSAVTCVKLIEEKIF